MVWSCYECLIQLFSVQTPEATLSGLVADWPGWLTHSCVRLDVRRGAAKQEGEGAQNAQQQQQQEKQEQQQLQQLQDIERRMRVCSKCEGIKSLFS